MQVVVSKWGNSLGLRLPRALTAEIGVAEGQKVDIRAADGRVIIIEPVRPIYACDAAGPPRCFRLGRRSRARAG